MLFHSNTESRPVNVSYLSSRIVLKSPDSQKHEILTDPVLQEKAARKRVAFLSLPKEDLEGDCAVL
jgi:hypothetical protein